MSRPVSPARNADPCCTYPATGPGPTPGSPSGGPSSAPDPPSPPPRAPPRTTLATTRRAEPEQAGHRASRAALHQHQSEQVNATDSSSGTPALAGPRIQAKGAIKYYLVGSRVISLFRTDSEIGPEWTL